MELSLYQIDAFSDVAFAGNPAAVCPLEGWLDDGRLTMDFPANPAAPTSPCSGA